MIRLHACVQYRDERPSTSAEVMSLFKLHSLGRVLVLHGRTVKAAPAVGAVSAAIFRALVDVIQLRVDQAHVIPHHLNQLSRIYSERCLQEEYVRMIGEGGRRGGR